MIRFNIFFNPLNIKLFLLFITNTKILLFNIIFLEYKDYYIIYKIINILNFLFYIYIKLLSKLANIL